MPLLLGLADALLACLTQPHGQLLHASAAPSRHRHGLGFTAFANAHAGEESLDNPEAGATGDVMDDDNVEDLAAEQAGLDPH